MFGTARGRQKYIADWLVKYGVESPLQLEVAIRQKRLFALVYQQCMAYMTTGEVEDFAFPASCIQREEQLENAAGADLTKSVRK